MTTGGPGTTMRPETVLLARSGGTPFSLSDKSDKVSDMTDKRSRCFLNFPSDNGFFLRDTKHKKTGIKPNFLVLYRVTSPTTGAA